MGVDSGCSVAVGPGGHADRVVAEDLLRRSQRRLLDAAFAVRQRPSSGKTAFGSAQTKNQLADVIRNTFIQGTLSILFATVVVVVLIAAIIMIIKAIRGGGLPLTEDDPVASKMFAPSGMIATASERGVQRQWSVLALMHLDH